MKVFIVNSVALNAGDAAILMGEIQALREAFGPHVEIEVADQIPETARKLYPGVTFTSGLHSRKLVRRYRPPVLQSIRWRRSWLAVRLLRPLPWLARMLFSSRQRAHLRRMQESDLVVATGGTYFVEHYNFSGKADEVIAAQALGTPTWLFTQSMGPFRVMKHRALLRRLVAGSRGVFLRDERSRAHLLEIGADASKLSVHPDAAFALADPAALKRAVAGQAPTRPRIAISVRSWSHAKNERGETGDAATRYRHAVADAARTLARSGAEVVFISTCQGVPEYWADDSSFATELVDELLAGEPGISVDTRFRTPAELATTLGGFQVAIATRMHFAILALSAGTPVVAIAYEFKTRELLRGMQLEELVTDFETVTADWLVERTRHVLEHSSALRASITEQVLEYREAAMLPAVRMRESLAHDPHGAPHSSGK